ncbi:MAG: class I SAM-dependent methyltransferase [Pirellulaceae bacterium]
MNKIKIEELQGPQATLLMPLWARAVEARHPQAILRDETSAAIVDSLDYNFSDFERRGVPIADYCIRSRVFDELTRGLMADRPDLSVVELGAGLDTRFDRLDNDSLRWLEFDMPEVIELRRRFFETTDRRRMLAASLLDDDWTAKVREAAPTVDLFVVEGVFYFLSSSEVVAVLKRIADEFPGARVIFDAQSPLFVRYSNLRQPIDRAQLRFSLRHPKDVEQWDPRFKMEKYVGFGDAPFYTGVMHRLAWYKRLIGLAHPLTWRLFTVNQVRLGEAD